jgi:hypothetical protein
VVWLVQGREPLIAAVRPLNNLGDWSTMFVRHLQFSTLELIAATTVIGLLMASAVIDGLLSTIAIVVAALFFWGCLIVAFIGRGYERAFATGFCLSFGLYCGILLMLGAGEFDPAAGQLPTSRVALPVFNAIVKRQYTDATFGTILPDYDPSVPETINGMPLVRSVSTAESPTRMHFMTIVHLFWAIAMGYTGAKFAIAWSRKDNAKRA